MNLLPPNATPLERALASACDMDLDPTPVSWLADANRCPAPFLPWLAWERSVDGWNEAIAEGPRRELIRRSIDIHKHKGTAGAVRRALGALGVSVEFKEWQDLPGAAPFTFGLTAWVNENHDNQDTTLLTPALYARLKRMVDEVKNERSHYTFRVGARFDQTPLRLANAQQSTALARSTALAQAVQPAPAMQSLRLANAQQSTALARRTALAKAVQPLPAIQPLQLANASQALGVVRTQVQPLGVMPANTSPVRMASALRPFSVLRCAMEIQ